MCEGEFFDGREARGGVDVVYDFRGHFGGGGAPDVFSLAEAGGEAVVDVEGGSGRGTGGGREEVGWS